MDGDFNIKMTVRNARLLRRIREAFGTPSEMARQTGITATALSALVTMRATPLRQDGSLTRTAEQVCGALGCYPEDVWPKHIENVKVSKATREVELTAAAVEQIASSEASVMQRMLLEKWTEALDPRERIAIDGARGDWTFDELGKELGVSRERARQIQCRAFRKIRLQAQRNGVSSFEEAIL